MQKSVRRLGVEGPSKCTTRTASWRPSGSGSLLFAASVLAVALMPAIATAQSSAFMVSRPEAVDGRTFQSEQGQHYRLHAVDVPDLGQQCLGPDGERYACGEASRNALGSLFNGLLTCQQVGSEPQGMPTVRCTDFAGRDIGAVLVAKGWAITDRGRSLDYVFEEMEAEARDHGLWQGRFVPPAQWRAGARL